MTTPRKYTDEQIVAILQEHQGGRTAKEVIRCHGIALESSDTQSFIPTEPFAPPRKSDLCRVSLAERNGQDHRDEEYACCDAEPIQQAMTLWYEVAPREVLQV